MAAACIHHQTPQALSAMLETIRDSRAVASFNSNMGVHLVLPLGSTCKFNDFTLNQIADGTITVQVLSIIPMARPDACFL